MHKTTCLRELHCMVKKHAMPLQENDPWNEEVLNFRSFSPLPGFWRHVWATPVYFLSFDSTTVHKLPKDLLSEVFFFPFLLWSVPTHYDSFNTWFLPQRTYRLSVQFVCIWFWHSASSLGRRFVVTMKRQVARNSTSVVFWQLIKLALKKVEKKKGLIKLKHGLLEFITYIYAEQKRKEKKAFSSWGIRFSCKCFGHSAKWPLRPESYLMHYLTCLKSHTKTGFHLPAYSAWVMNDCNC